eukprot:gene22963-29148_t
MRCCSLAMVLVKSMTLKTRRLLAEVPKQRKKSVNDLTGPEEEDQHNSDNDDVPTELDVANAKQQLTAQLSFKEALSSALCNEALTNAFREYWSREQVAPDDDNKIHVSTCFAYIRRVLSIETHPNWSTAGEIATHHRVHHKYITRLKQVISVIPGICGDLERNRKYHDDWLADIIRIIFCVLRDFDTKQLFLAYKTDALISSFRDILGDAPEGDEVQTPAVESKARQNLQPVVVPALFKAGVREAKTTTGGGGGGLMDMIKKDQIGRQARAAVGSDSNRFRGVYRVVKGGDASTLATSSSSSADSSRVSSSSSKPTSNSQSAAIVSPQNNPTQSATSKSSVTIFRDPFSTSEGIIPQAKAKASKKSLTFAMDASDDSGVAGSAMGDDFQQACIVAASLTDLLSHELSLKTFVRRVNDVLRRQDVILDDDDVLMYYQVITKLLSYHRLKLADEHAQFIQQQKASPSSAVWEPNLKNVMDALDNMSFQRVVDSIEFYMTPPKGPELKRTTPKEKLAKLHIPMTLLKEMICYLRVLLESGLEGHHEIAIAALYRLYYTNSTDRQDPLGKLLTQWRAGAFSRKHVDSLVELVHETLTTLDAAHRMYSDDDSAGDKKKRPKAKKDQSLEAYVVGCMRFDVDEYFRRIVSNNSVRMYTRVLQNYDTNDPQVNGHTYKFLQRMCSFKLEQMCKAPMPSADGKPAVLLSAMDYEEVHLGFILFNIQTLLVFSTILSDPEICANAPRYNHLRPLVALIHSLVRRFGDASKKNHLFFLELIFQHPRPDGFCSQLDSVYEAPYYARTSSGFGAPGSAKKKKRGGVSDDDSLSANSSGDEEDFGDVFDENNVSEAFAATTAKKLREEAKRAKAAKEGTANKVSRLQKKTKPRRNDWSAAEDEALREEFLLYAGSAGVFTAIAESAGLRDLGGNRNHKHVQTRCKELGLRAAPDSDAEGGDGDDEEEEEAEARGPADREEDTYPQNDVNMVTQEDSDMSPSSAHASSSSSSSSRKKARLVLRDSSAAELPRAEWDTDDTTDVFEQRSLGLTNGNGAASKKLFRKSAVTAGSESDEDDLLMEVEEGKGVSSSTSKAPGISTSKSRSMRIASDDEDE